MSAKELYTQFDSVFFEKTRLSIMTILYREREVSFNRFKHLLAGTDGATYVHLKKLGQAGYLEHHKEIVGNSVQTIYALSKKGEELFKHYLHFLEKMVLKKDRP